MPAIQRIRVSLKTMDTSGAGTDGDVYLGVCGREFSLDSSADDFERGANRDYIFGGSDANVRFKELNDPTKPQLDLDNVDQFPVYLRFNPQNRSDNWHVQRVQVYFNDVFFTFWDTAYVIPLGLGIMLGTRAGLRIGIPNGNNLIAQQHDGGAVVASVGRHGVNSA